jgi:hemoglobin-like flavoprotein
MHISAIAGSRGGKPLSGRAGNLRLFGLAEFRDEPSANHLPPFPQSEVSVSTTAPAQTSAAEQVKLSYGRCCMRPTFFDDFYNDFTSTSAAVRAKFTKTDFAKQKALLRQGIAYLIMFNSGSPSASSAIRKLGETHCKSRLNIEPAMYELWLGALLRTVRKHDPQFTPELGADWRSVLNKGIAAMKSVYNQ